MATLPPPHCDKVFGTRDMVLKVSHRRKVALLSEQAVTAGVANNSALFSCQWILLVSSKCLPNIRLPQRECIERDTSRHGYVLLAIDGVTHGTVTDLAAQRCFPQKLPRASVQREKVTVPIGNSVLFEKMAVIRC